MVQMQINSKIKASVALILTITFFIISSNVSAQQVNWTQKISLESHSEWKAQSPDIAVDGKNIYAVWNCFVTEYASVISFKRSTDAGKTWDETVRFTSEDGIADFSKIAVNKNYVHVVWRDFKGEYPEIYYKRSEDSGKTWDEEIQLTHNNTISFNLYDIKVEACESAVYVVWKDYRNESSEVYFKKSMNNGEAWSFDKRVSHDYTPSYHPAIAVDRNYIWIVWDDWGNQAEICFSMSEDFGESWSKKQYLTEQGQSKEADIAVSENDAFIVWQDDRDGNYEIYFKQKIGGEGWSEDQQLTYDDASSVNPRIGVYQNVITLVWQDDRDGNYEIYFKQKIGGEGWSEDQQLTYTYNEQMNPSLAVQANNIYVAWKSDHGSLGSDIHYICAISKTPILTLLNVSKTSLIKPDSIRIYVYGFDNKYNTSDLTCTIQYKSPFGDWRTINGTIFKNDRWEGLFEITNESGVGEYSIRAVLINPSGNQSEWFQLDNITVSIKETNDETPGFELISIILIISILIFKKRLYSYVKRRKNDEKR